MKFCTKSKSVFESQQCDVTMAVTMATLFKQLAELEQTFEGIDEFLHLLHLKLCKKTLQNTTEVIP